jgi:hypothetical protein
MKFLLLLPLFFMLAGCGVMPLNPGKAAFISNSGISGSVQQSQNPQSETTQKYKRTVEENLGKGIPAEAPSRVTTEEIETHIGAAQKDTAREMAAKLSSLKGVVWVGIVVFLFGAGTFVYPPLKLIVGGSMTTSAVITGAGLAMIVLPTLIVGHELMILCVAVGAAALYYFSNRHGKLQGFVDANKDGIDDRKQ